MKLNIYLHCPFCLKKCRYCDFFSVAGNRKKIAGYLQSLKKEIFFRGRELKQSKIQTLYFGGGTPSILDSADFQKIVGWLKQNFLFQKELEFSIEANPETITAEKIRIWKKARVNRVSLGAQTFSDKYLKILGRVHSAAKSRAAIALLKKYFKNINIDLMFALPGPEPDSVQTLAEFEADLQEAVRWNPAHISVYQLTPEKGTALWALLKKKKLLLPSEDTTFQMFRLAIDFLKQKGFRHYEISNFSRPGRECRHNLAVWHFEPYLGLGPGAHSFMFNRRRANPEDLQKYRDQKLPPLKWSRKLSEKGRIKLPAEYMFLGLRCLEGIYIKDFENRFGIKITKIYQKSLDKLQKQKLISITSQKILLTRRGVFLGNEVFQEFV